MVTAEISIENIIGHLVKAEVTTKGMFGSSRSTHEGRVVYSVSKESLFFMPKGSRNRGYQISEEDIHSVEVIRKDKDKHALFLNEYVNREEKIERKREQEDEQYKQKQIAREERRLEEERIKKEKEEAEAALVQSLDGYNELEQEAIAFYESFENDFFNRKTVLNIFVPCLGKILNKAIPDVSEFPKHYFDKKHNPKFTSLIEKKLGIKLASTQKRNVEILNRYLASK